MAQKYIYTASFLLCLPILHSEVQAQISKSSRPNVIFIYADDIGYGDFSCNGATTIHTPNIDRAAREGLRFTNAHSAAATSTPSRYALLTGEYAWRRKGTGIANGDAGAIISPQRFTLPRFFKQAGYATGVVGKWHLGLGEQDGGQDWNKTLYPGANDIGFDYSFIMAATGDRVPCVYVENCKVCNLNADDPIAVSYQHNFPGEPTGKENPELLIMHPSHGHDMSIINGISRIGYMKGGKSALWKDDKIAETLAGKAVGFIKKYASSPFFLYFATQDAHVPRVPGKAFVGKSGMGARGDCLLEFDWCVGEILRTVENLGLSRNTLIVISSDNGPVVDDGYQDKAVEMLGNHKPGGIYKGGKYSIYEAGTRIPCIWHWPGTIKSGVSDALLCQIDWFATLAQLLRRPLPKNAAPDSRPMWKAWSGKTKKGRNKLVLQNAQNNLSLIEGEWKYVRPGQGPAYNKEVNIELGNSMQPQLYNLRNDPSEQHNVAIEYPQRVEKMGKELKKEVDNRYGLTLPK